MAQQKTGYAAAKIPEYWAEAFNQWARGDGQETGMVLSEMDSSIPQLAAIMDWTASLIVLSQGEDLER